jgi:hypothetical protein
MKVEGGFEECILDVAWRSGVEIDKNMEILK